MGCGSCGGSRVVASSPAGGARSTSTQVVRKPVRYVWQWTSANGGEKKTFDSEQEAREFVGDQPGFLTVVPSFDR